MKSYVLRVAVAAMGCGLLQALIPQKGSGKIFRLLCGLFLLLVACRGSFNPEALELPSLQQYRQEAAVLCQEAETAWKQEMASLISQELEAYIENKAAALGVQVGATVFLGGDMIPETVTLTGQVSPYIRQRLSQDISSSLGISEQQQQWVS